MPDSEFAALPALLCKLELADSLLRH